MDEQDARIVLRLCTKYTDLFLAHGGWIERHWRDDYIGNAVLHVCQHWDSRPDEMAVAGFVKQHTTWACMNFHRDHVDPLSRAHRRHVSEGTARPVQLVSLDLVAEEIPLDHLYQHGEPDRTEEVLDRMVTRQAILDLTETERDVLTRNLSGERLKVIGQSMGVTESRACQIKSGACARINRALAV